MQLTTILRMSFRLKGTPSIKQIFKSLPYIVFKRKFLIPNRPLKPVPVRQRVNKLMARCLDKQTVAKYSRQQIIKLNPEIEQQIRKINQQYQREMQQYNLDKEQYQRNYIQPAKIMYKCSWLLFKQQKMRQFNKQLSLVSMTKKITKLWRQLPAQIKQQWNLKSSKYKEEKMLEYEEYCKKHQIPVKKKFTPTIAIFVQQFKNTSQNGRFDSQFLTKYNQCPEQKRKQYKEIANKKNTQNLIKLKIFLEYWGISQQELNYYANISQRYTYQKKKQVSKKQNKLKQLQNNPSFKQ